MAVAELHVETRAASGPAETKQIRREGKIPAVYYSSDSEPLMLAVDKIVFQRLVSHELNVLDVVLPDKKKLKCIIREIQRDPVNEAVVHIDFMGIKLDVEVSLTIPVILQGTPTGVKDGGGILEHSLRQLEVKGLPMEIPEHVEIDVSALAVGESIHVKDITIDKVEILTDPEQDLASVTMPKKAEAEAEEGLLEKGEEGAEAAEIEPESE